MILIGIVIHINTERLGADELSEFLKVTGGLQFRNVLRAQRLVVDAGERDDELSEVAARLGFADSRLVHRACVEERIGYLVLFGRQKGLVKRVAVRDDVVALVAGDAEAERRHDGATEHRVQREPFAVALTAGSSLDHASWLLTRYASSLPLNLAS